MKKIFTLAAMLLAAFAANAQNESTKENSDLLSIGDYAGLLENGDDSQCYQGSFYAKCPTTFYLKHTGTQIIYTKEELQKMAGKDITGIKFLYNNASGTQAYPRTVKVWLMETGESAFSYNEKDQNYDFFNYDAATQTVNGYNFDYDFSEVYGMNGELIINFDNPFKYSGNKNLLVVITFDGEETTGGSMDVNFFCNSDIKKRAMTYVNDGYSFEDYKATEDWPATNLETGTNLELPVTQFVFKDSGTSGINNAITETAGENSPVFHISGQRVSREYKGLVITNGKKYFRK